MSQANEILLQMKYARIINGLAERLHIDNRKALRLFYESNTFASRLLSNCTKSLVLSTLLHHVSVVTMLVRLVF